MNPCPICALTGGFHDRAIHGAHVVPAEALTAGDRLDAHLIAEARKDPIYAALHDGWLAHFEAALIGDGKATPTGVLSALSGGELG